MINDNDSTEKSMGSLKIVQGALVILAKQVKIADMDSI